MRERQAILLQVEALSLSEKNDLPEDSQFLLEFNIGRLQQADYETQCYWVAASGSSTYSNLWPRSDYGHTHTAANATTKAT
jgi:hypothetical protein